MVIKLSTVAIVVFLYMATVFATCNKRLDCTEIIYSFERKYKAYPDLDSVHLGDTTWIELNVPSQLKDITSSQLIDYSGAENFGPSIQYLELTGGDALHPGAVPAAASFYNVLHIGTTIPSNKPELVLGFRCQEVNGIYKFKLGIVSKKKGLFAIGVSNATGVSRKKYKCDKASFNLTFENTNQHLYLYEQSRPGYIISEYERSHLYCFKVY